MEMDAWEGSNSRRGRKRPRGLICSMICLIFGSLLVRAQAPQATQSNGTPTVEPFTYTTVLVKYVAGTVPSDAKNRRTQYLGKLGCLLSTDDKLFFRPYPNQAKIRRFAGFLTHLANPSWAKGGGHCPSDILPPPPLMGVVYGDIQILAQDQVQDQSSASANDIQLIGGIGSLAGAASINSPAGYIGLGSVAAISLGYYVSRRTQNYITIFLRKPGGAGATDKSDIKQPKSEDGFCKCDFVVFQVIDPHDYRNVSLLLNAKTGKAFVPVRKEASSDSSK